MNIKELKDKIKLRLREHRRKSQEIDPKDMVEAFRHYDRKS